MRSRGKILNIVHHGQEDAGRIGDILTERGFESETRMPVKGEALPVDPGAYAGVVILGGIMSANDDHLPGIRQELDWIPKVIASGCPLLGCCLGGQLIARALGARVYKQPQGVWEIGYSPIYATPAGGTIFPRDRQYFFSWHQDAFDVPTGAELLARGDDSFPNQAFRFGSQTFGLQFHPEASSKEFIDWLQHSPGFERHPGAHERSRILDDAALHERDADVWLGDFLQHWVDMGETRTELNAG